MMLAAVIAFAALGVACLFGAWTALEPYRRFFARARSDVASLDDGPALVAGTLRASGEALAAFDGTPVIVAALELDTFRERRETSAEVADATGVCQLDIQGALLLAEERVFHVTSAELAESHAAVWARLPKAFRDSAPEQVVVKEAIVRHGSEGLVHGQARSIPRPVGADYRRPKAAFRIERVMLSGFSTQSAKRQLLRPALVLSATAAIAFAAAATFAYFMQVLASA